MLNERLLLSCLCRKSMYYKYKSSIAPGYFSDMESRKVYETMSGLHEKSTGDIPLELLHLPEVMDLPLAEASLEDFAVRCKLNEVQLSLAKRLNSPKLLTISEIESTMPGVGRDLPVSSDLKLYQGNGYIRPRYPIDCGPMSAALEGGMSCGELCIIGSPPWGGKTHTLTTFGAWAVSQGHPVLHVILEDLAHDVHGYYQKALGVKETPGHLFLLDSNSGPTTVPTVSKYINKIFLKYYQSIQEEARLTGNTLIPRPPLVIVDYMDIVHSEHEDKVIRLENITRDLRRMANKHNLLVMTASQTDVDSWGKSFITNRNLAGSKVGKAANADIIIMLAQEDWQRPSGQAKFIITKGRGRRIRQQEFPVVLDWDNCSIRFMVQQEPLYQG